MFLRIDGAVVERRVWNFKFHYPTDQSQSKLAISYDDVAIIVVDGLVASAGSWTGLPDRNRFGPHARAVLDLCLPGILGTVAEILAMKNGAAAIAFDIATLMNLPGGLETQLKLDFEVENQSRVRELLAPFNIV